jgi:hypothetical protein
LSSLLTKKAVVFMTEPSNETAQEHTTVPVIQLSYICVFREQLRESSTSLYEVACSITYPAKTAHLSLRVTGQNTYRNSAAKEVSFTMNEAGATAYVELLESEQLEVRIVEFGGAYSRTFFHARHREINEQNARRVSSTIQQLEVINEITNKERVG